MYNQLCGHSLVWTLACDIWNSFGNTTEVYQVLGNYNIPLTDCVSPMLSRSKLYDRIPSHDRDVSFNIGFEVGTHVIFCLKESHALQ